jgi:hypothetical protein
MTIKTVRPVVILQINKKMQENTSPGSAQGGWLSSAVRGAQSFIDSNIKPWIKENYEVGRDIINDMQDVAIKAPFAEPKDCVACLIGLDRSGKSTFINMMKNGTFVPAQPTKTPSLCCQ